LDPSHSTSSGVATMRTCGFTVMVYVIAVPWQLTPFKVMVGVTVMVPEIGAVVVLVAVKAGRGPLPL
jgi:hypothetical protein